MLKKRMMRKTIIEKINIFVNKISQNDKKVVMC